MLLPSEEMEKMGGGGFLKSLGSTVQALIIAIRTLVLFDGEHRTEGAAGQVYPTPRFFQRRFVLKLLGDQSSRSRVYRALNQRQRFALLTQRSKEEEKHSATLQITPNDQNLSETNNKHPES